MIAPSGEQFEITAADQRAVIVEVGGGLRSYSAGGRELLDGYGADEMCTSGRGQVLIPWPNRLQDGSYEFEGRRHRLPLTEPDTQNAIHGLVRWASWTAAEREPHRVVMEHALHPAAGLPVLARAPHRVRAVRGAASSCARRRRTSAANHVRTGPAPTRT